MDTPIFKQSKVCLERIDYLLCLYYQRMGVNNYVNNLHQGRFLHFVKQNKHDNQLIISNPFSHGANNCVLLDFDDAFPIQNNWKLFINLYNISKKEIIFYILQFCYKYNKLPTEKEIENYLDLIKYTRYKPTTPRKQKRQRDQESNSFYYYPAINKRLKLDIFPTSCHTLSDCVAVRRLSETMHCYHCQMVNIDNINILQILNDYLHLLGNHDSFTDFDIIRNAIGYCNISSCFIIKRMYRNRDIDKRTYKSDIVDKIHNYYMHSLIIGNKHKMTQTSAGLNNLLYNRMDLKYNRNTFDYGVEFTYGYKGEELNDVSCSFKMSPHFASLKDEMTRNDVSILSMEQFQNEYEKASIHLQSYYCKQHFCPFKDDYIDEDMKTKSIKWNFSIQYLLSLMIYCNYSELQYQFSKTYRTPYLQSHCMFYHMGKYLKIAVKKFGKRIADGKINTFYHGLSEPFIFSQYINNQYASTGISIMCPLSTSVEFAVAINFTNDNNGIVIEFAGYGDKWTKYFSVCWLSDFSSEREYLFIQNSKPYERLTINSILNARSGVDYASILKALQILNHIITNRVDPREIACNMCSILSWIFIRNIMDHVHEKNCHSPLQYYTSSKWDDYAENLICTYFKNKKKIIMDHSRVKEPTDRYLEETNLIYIDIIEQLRHMFFNLFYINTLFTNLEEIVIYSVNLRDFSLDQIEDYFACMDSDTQINSITMIHPNLEGIDCNLKDIETKYKRKFEEIGFDVRVYDKDQIQDCILIEKLHTKMQTDQKTTNSHPVQIRRKQSAHKADFFEAEKETE